MNTNQQPPKTRPADPTRALQSYFPSRFIKPADFNAWQKVQIEVTITRAQEEEVQPKPGQTEWKLVLYFTAKDGKEYPRGYLVTCKADIENLQKSTGALTIADLPGKKIAITLAEWRGAAVLRISPANQYEEI